MTPAIASVLFYFSVVLAMNAGIACDAATRFRVPGRRRLAWFYAAVSAIGSAGAFALAWHVLFTF